MPARKMQALQPVKARAPEWARDVSASAAFKTIATTLLGEMHANRLGAIEGGDPEFLHQMRVAVRRLRALCGVYVNLLPKHALRSFIAELKWLARALGPARDADVFVIEVWPPLCEVLYSNPLCQALDARWVAQRRAAAARLRRTLASPRYQRLIRASGHWLATDAWRASASKRQRAVLCEPVRFVARKVLKRRNAKVRGYGNSLKRLDDAQLHALRIQVKKLRYTTDSFASLFASAAVRKMLAHLSHLQNVLGEINDLRVAGQQVEAALAGRRGSDVAQLRETLASWQASRTSTLRHKLNAAWRVYRRAGRVW